MVVHLASLNKQADFMSNPKFLVSPVYEFPS